MTRIEQLAYEVRNAYYLENYYHDVEEYTDRLISGDITEGRFRQLVEYARNFWLSANK